MFSTLQDSKISGSTVDDLQVLLYEGAAEGQFVEYKSALVKPGKIDTSIASFANSNGGWCIVRVAADRTTNSPVRIGGLAPQEPTDPASTIRDAVKRHLSPTPVFHAEIDLLATRHRVAVVRVPDRQGNPTISKDGRIYRRVADSSDPVFEDERHAIDRLVDAGREYSLRFEEFFKDDRASSRGEAEHRWLHIYLRPNPDWINRPSAMMVNDLQAPLSECSELVPTPVGDEVASLPRLYST